jgi:hypothetical protein
MVVLVMVVGKEACRKGHKREAARRPRKKEGTRSKGHERRVNVVVVWCGKEGKEGSSGGGKRSINNYGADHSPVSVHELPLTATTVVMWYVWSVAIQGNMLTLAVNTSSTPKWPFDPPAVRRRIEPLTTQHS